MDSPRMKFMDQAADKEATRLGKVFATTTVLCATLVVVMVTVKVGMLLFG
jgi:hypothetical protein